jgi:hypothetical protein
VEGRVGLKDELFKLPALRLQTSLGSVFRSARISQQTKNDSDTPSKDGSAAVIPLAVEQMIDFFAKFVEIIQTEINDRITDISYLIHFL